MKEKIKNVDEIISELEKECKHKLRIKGAVVTNISLRKNIPEYSTITQCILCKEIFIGE